MTEIFTAPPPPPSAIGLRVPDFTVPATGGEFVLSAFQGKPLVLYFYPKDNTPGCTTQAQQFRDLHAEFVKAGCWGFPSNSSRISKGCCAACST